MHIRIKRVPSLVSVSKVFINNLTRASTNTLPSRCVLSLEDNYYFLIPTLKATFVGALAFLKFPKRKFSQGLLETARSDELVLFFQEVNWNFAFFGNLATFSFHAVTTKNCFGQHCRKMKLLLLRKCNCFQRGKLCLRYLTLNNCFLSLFYKNEDMKFCKKFFSF